MSKHTFIMAKTCTQFDFWCGTCIQISSSGETQLLDSKTLSVSLGQAQKSDTVNCSGVPMKHHCGLKAWVDFSQGCQSHLTGFLRGRRFQKRHQQSTRHVKKQRPIKRSQGHFTGLALEYLWSCVHHGSAHLYIVLLSYSIFDVFHNWYKEWWKTWPQNTCHSLWGFSPNVHKINGTDLFRATNGHDSLRWWKIAEKAYGHPSALRLHLRLQAP